MRSTQTLVFFSTLSVAQNWVTAAKFIFFCILNNDNILVYSIFISFLFLSDPVILSSVIGRQSLHELRRYCVKPI